jgi:hypothetical protein
MVETVETVETVKTETEDTSRLNEIIKHIAKPKKLVLPKLYLVNIQQRQMQFNDLEDNLQMEKNIVFLDVNASKASTSSNAHNVFEPEPQVIKEKSIKVKKQNRKKKTTVIEEAIQPEIEEIATVIEPVIVELKPKRPSAYNIFVKDALSKLQESHKDMTSKERFSLAIHMWNESKVLRTD